MFYWLYFTEGGEKRWQETVVARPNPVRHVTARAGLFPKTPTSVAPVTMSRAPIVGVTVSSTSTDRMRDQ